MDPLHCILLGLAVFLEIFINLGGGGALTTPYVFGFSDDENIPAGGQKAKENVQTILATVIDNWKSLMQRRVLLEATACESLHLRMQGRTDA
jgi:hypothetical protein